jgi:hypothetical protein
MKVPELEQSAGINPTPVGQQGFAAPPQAAFGGEMAQATQRMGATVEGIGEKLGDVWLQRQQMLKESQAFDAYSRYGRDLQDLTRTSDESGAPKIDPETMKPVGLLDRELADANGITVEFDRKQQALKGQYVAELKDPSQRAMFDKMASYHSSSLRESIIQHEARQGQAEFAESQKAAMAAITDSAGIIQDPAALKSAILVGYSITSKVLQRQGVSDPKVAAGEYERTAAAIVERPINEQLANGSWKTARALLDSVKERVSQKFADDAMAKISAKAFDDTREGVWTVLRQSPNLRMQDGKTFDEEKARALIMDPKHLTLADPITGKPMETEQREKVVQFVKSMAGEEAQQQRKQEAAANASYSNAVVAGRAAGSMDLQAAHKLAADPRFGFDASGIQGAQDFATRLFSGSDIKSDPETLVSLHRGLDDGTITSADDIRKQMTEGMLSKHDTVALINKLQRGDTQAMKTQWSAIEAAAKEKLPDGPSLKAFVASLRQQASEKGVTDPADLQKLYKSNMETAPTGAPGFFRIFGGKTAAYYKTAEALQQNQALVKSLGGTDAAMGLAQRVGGPDALAAGSPKAAAIGALIKAGWKASQIGAEHIEAVIANPGKKIPGPSDIARR